ncbi:MurR/RpiR family transcriptional regulator [Leeia sp. TBRC 13508]|uniref:MurR/RpiR family transcriptional regulator n=1 Tax=Leeia speluncae TaxID=2884804 RepID=A0ABS8DB10_9NEIS|nr:MurR/RpiR family transcriptional regulator [Leeia speluncae]MCB6185337.1 MurR/RpiR family transcriptional regulator [Leeia speluncae]
MSDVSAAEQLMSRIANEFDTLSKQLKVIAKYIEQNRQELVLAKISDIANACDVQPSAIVRFSQRFGFTGFSEMQAVFRTDFAASQKSVPATNYRQRIRQLIATQPQELGVGDMTREFVAACQAGLDDLSSGLNDKELEKAVELLAKAENIYVLGVRRNFSIASYIAYALQHTNKRVHLINGLGGMYREQIRSIREGDVLIAISFTPYAKETRYCVRAAHQHKAKALVITDSQLSPLSRYAHALLTVKEGTAFAFRSLTSTICLCQALFIALAYRLELDIEETKDVGGYDD